MLWKEKRKEFALILFWILITPLATMFMSDTHALRNGLMLPPILLADAYAFTRIPKKFIYISGLLIFLQFVYILVRIYTIAPAKFASFWSAEAKYVAEKALEADKKGEKATLYINKVDNIEYAYEVYAKVDPYEVISQYGKLPKIYGNVTITDK